MITDQLCYGCGSKEHKILKCNKKNNIFVTNNERCKRKQEEMRGIMEKCGEVKSLKLKFHPNNTRNEAVIWFSTEEKAQLAVTEINTYVGWRAELYKPTKKSREFERVKTKSDNSNKEHEQRKKNKSSTKQVELHCLKEEIKDIKRTLDILLKTQWPQTPKDSKEDSTDQKNQKIKQKQIKNIENNKEQSINSNKEQEKKQEKDKGNKKESITRKRVRRSKRIKNALKIFKIYYQNVRGLKSKLDSLQDMIDDYQPSLICIVETDMQKEEEIQIPGDSLVYHNDRSANSGGIPVRVRDNIKNISLELTQENKVGQSLWILITNTKKKLE